MADSAKHLELVTLINYSNLLSSTNLVLAPFCLLNSPVDASTGEFRVNMVDIHG